MNKKMKGINLTYILILLIFCSCKRAEKQNSLPLIWQSSEIRYTAPMFYLEGMKYRSTIHFVHHIAIVNSAKNPMMIDLTNNIHEFYQGKYSKLKPVYNHNRVLIEPSDSTIISVRTLEKFSTEYNPTTLDKNIFATGDMLLENSKLIYINDSDTIEINKSKSFDTSAKSSVQERIGGNL